jgi:hypothetical protein
METAPTRGYILPLWKDTNAYRATALAYMLREKINTVENINGRTYTIADIKASII